MYHLIFVPKIKVSLFLVFTDQLLSVPKIIAFFSMLPSENKNSDRESNPMPLPLYLYLSRSAFLVSFKDANKELFHVNSVQFS